ncbi:MAG: PilZ domain-containing protein, partial [Nitrospinales bacterium]|nr:PilZ domain-containing protein [Nitrospinales bacterium]
MNRIKEQRVSLRVGIKRLTSIIRKGGGYELIQGDKETKTTTTRIVDISSGGLCIESKKILKSGVNFELEMPKIMHLESTVLSCEVTRSIFREDPRCYLNMGTTKDKSYYE